MIQCHRSLYILRYNKILYQEGENVIKRAQKKRESHSDPDDNQGEAGRFLTGWPIDVANLRSRLTEKFFYPGKHSFY